MSKEKLLRIETPTFVAGLIMEYSEDRQVWECVRAATILNKIIGWEAKSIKGMLMYKKRNCGWNWEWVDES